MANTIEKMGIDYRRDPSGKLWEITIRPEALDEQAKAVLKHAGIACITSTVRAAGYAEKNIIDAFLGKLERGDFRIGDGRYKVFRTIDGKYSVAPIKVNVELASAPVITGVSLYMDVRTANTLHETLEAEIDRLILGIKDVDLELATSREEVFSIIETAQTLSKLCVDLKKQLKAIEG